MNILLNDKLICRFDIIWITCNEDTFTLAGVFGFDDESPCVLFGRSFMNEIFIIVRHHICERKEIILIWKKFTHSHQMATKHVLSSEIIDSWDLINSLVKFHVLKELNINSSIKPCYVPIGFFLTSKMVF